MFEIYIIYPSTAWSKLFEFRLNPSGPVMHLHPTLHNLLVIFLKIDPKELVVIQPNLH